MLDMKYSHESETLAFELSFGRARDFPEFKSRDPFAEADKIMRICDDVILFREEAQTGRIITLKKAAAHERLPFRVLCFTRLLFSAPN